MMTNVHAKAAYKQESYPKHLNKNDYLAYDLLKDLYKQYSNGIIDIKNAKKIKSFLMDYDNILVKEKRAILSYFKVHLENENSNKINHSLICDIKDELLKIKTNYIYGGI